MHHSKFFDVRVFSLAYYCIGVIAQFCGTTSTRVNISDYIVLTSTQVYIHVTDFMCFMLHNPEVWLHE